MCSWSSDEPARRKPHVIPDVIPDVIPEVIPDMLADVLLERVAPVADPLADFFWRSGADGVLRILRCADCGYYVHPPSTPCPRCLSAKVGPEPVSGRAVVHTFTVNVQQWQPGQPPYVIAIVELAEQEGLRLTTNVLGCPPDHVYIDQPVRVDFVARDELHYPVFRPTE
ncbi:MAG TPA: OB-fold domain-containing protein [Pseudonocardia sp.]|jgi:uncharacterized OB-fold protein